MNRYVNPFFKILCLFLKPENFDDELKTVYRKLLYEKNNLTIRIFFLIITTDLIESVADLIMKKGLIRTGIHSVDFHNLLEFLSGNAPSYFIWLGILLYILNFFLWITVLSRVDLSVAFPVGSSSYILVPLLSKIFLNENIGLVRWLGITLIIAGIYSISRSGRKEGFSKA